MPCSRLFRRTTFCVSTVLVAACAADAVTSPQVIPLEQQTWASALQVNLAQFTKLNDGVYYLDAPVGTGAVLSGTPTVSVFYSGFLPNGTKFDERQLPSAALCFRLTDLIAGWKSGMQGMKVEGKRRLLIPSSLGYGPSGNGPIPANANLLFEITLKGTGCTP